MIQGYPFWAKIGQSVYIIKTPESYVQVRDKLVLVFDKNDKLFVGTVSAPAAWFNLGIPVDNWIKTYLR